MSFSSDFKLFMDDENSDGAIKWRKKILFLRMCSLLVILGLFALIVASVKLGQKEDQIFQNSTFVSSSTMLGGFGELKRIEQIKTGIFWLIDKICFEDKTQQAPCNEPKSQGQ